MNHEAATYLNTDSEQAQLRQHILDQELEIIRLKQQLAQLQSASYVDSARPTYEVLSMNNHISSLLLMEMLPDAVVLMDKNHTILFCNQQTAHMHGYTSPEHIIGKSIMELIAPEEHSAAYTNQTNSAADGVTGRFERTLCRRDGSTFQAEICTSVLQRDAQNQPIAFLSVARDITERTQIESALRASEARFRSLVNSAPVLIIIRQGNTIVYINQHGEDLIGYTLAELQQLPVDIFFHPDSITLAQEWIQQYQQETEPLCQTTLKIITKTQQVVWLDVSSTMIDFHGQPAMLSVGINVTNQKRAEAILIEQEKLLAHRRITNIVVHEIRNPLQNIKVMLETFSRDSVEQQQKSLVDLQTETDRLIHILQQIQGIYPNQPDNQSFVNINKLIQRIIRLTSGTIQQKKIQCTHTLNTHQPYVVGRADELTQVLLNVIFNAIESMPDGGSLHVMTTSDQSTATIQITDTGWGIAPHNLAHIFEPFFTTRKEGTGLGLFICHDILQRYGGSIDLANGQESGIIVTIKLPRAASADWYDLCEEQDE